jgi:acetyl esterase/lipase
VPLPRTLMASRTHQECQATRGRPLGGKAPKRDLVLVDLSILNGNNILSGDSPRPRRRPCLRPLGQSCWPPRAYLRSLLTAVGPAADPRVVVTDTVIPGPAGDLPVQIYPPAAAEVGTRLCALYFHDGAFISGDLDTGDRNCRDICLAADAVVVSVDYRLAPEPKYPAAFDDCYAAAGRARQLGIDPARLAVAGRSADGTLAAALALAARDRGGPALAFQVLLIPTLDDRSHASVDRPVRRPGTSARSSRPAADVFADRPGGPAARRGAGVRRAPHVRRVLTEVHLVPGAFTCSRATHPQAGLPAGQPPPGDQP